MLELIKNIPDVVLIIFMFAVGSVFGSFLNVLIYRLPRRCLSIVKPRSFCPKCKAPIAWYDNIPLVSYILLGGKCRHCKAEISLRYPLVEFLTAGLFALFFYKDIISVNPDALGYAHFLTLLTHLFVTLVLIAVFFIDYDLTIIPDSLSIGGTVVLLFFALINPLHGGYAQNPHAEYKVIDEKVRTHNITRLMRKVDNYQKYALVQNQAPVANWISKDKPQARSFFSALFGAFIGGFGTLLLSILMTGLFRKKSLQYTGGLALGLGDVKLMAFFGALLGWLSLPIILFLASFVGVIIGLPRMILKSKHGIPFGPFLAIAAIITVLFYGDILEFIGLHLLYH